MVAMTNDNLLIKNPTYFDHFDYFYFINSSCIGPFLPPILDNNYIEIINNKLTSYDLVGPIIEYPDDNHGYSLLNIDNNKNIPFIHTYMFAVNKSAFLLIQELFENLTDDKTENIYMERKISSYLLINNKKIYSFLMRFKNVDINDSENWDTSKWNNGLSCYEIPKNYFGMDINPLEVIFVKNIRNSHEHRKVENAGISKDLEIIIDNYSKWNER
jgi:hypothetical protein